MIGEGVLSGGEIKDIGNAFAADAADAPPVDVSIRFAQRDGAVFIDRGDAAWSVVKITADEISVIPYAKCGDLRFRRADDAGELPEPVLDANPAEDISLIWKYINVTEAARPLVLGWLLYALVYPKNVGHPHLVFSGPEGSGKSRSSRTLKRVTDGDEPIEAPANARDLAAIANTTQVLAFDNLSLLTKELQNALCKLSTGTKFLVRGLYTNFDTVGFKAVRPAILNGIGDVARASDLLDRSWLVETDQSLKTDAGRYQTDRALDTMLETDLPRILGALYHGVQAGLRSEVEVPEAEVRLKIGKPRRMMDAIVFSMRALPALGVDAEAFLDAYDTSRSHGHQITADSTTFNSLVIALAQAGNWKGTAAELRDHLIAECKSKDDYEAVRALPGTPKQVADALKRLSSVFSGLGLYLTAPRDKDRPRNWLMGPVAGALSAPAGYVNGYDAANWWRDLPADEEMGDLWRTHQGGETF